MNYYREDLLDLLRKDAYKKGEYVLSSGRRSEHYVNCKPVTLTGEGLSLVCPMFLECIDSDAQAVGGLTLGADPLVSGVTLVSSQLGTGINYSVNEVYRMFLDKFGADCTYIPDQKGNYRETLRENNDTVDRLNWKPEDRLKDYINSL